MTRRSPGSRLAGAVLIAGVWVYRGTLGLLIQVGIGPVCRFEPSCSQYMIEAIRLYGPVDGLRRGLRRLARCHPWHEGGYDPP